MGLAVRHRLLSRLEKISTSLLFKPALISLTLDNSRYRGDQDIEWKIRFEQQPSCAIQQLFEFEKSKKKEKVKMMSTIESSGSIAVGPFRLILQTPMMKDPGDMWDIESI